MRVFAYTNNNSNSLIECSPSNINYKKSFSFLVSNDKADEFVKKYNKQSSIMEKVTLLSTGVGFITGCLNKTNKIYGTIFRAIANSGACFLLSSFAAYTLNNRLFDKYNLKQINKQ